MRALFALSLVAASAIAQHGVVVGATARHGDIVTSADGLTLPRGEFTIGEMIDAAAGYLCRNYLYDRELVDQRRTFYLQRPLSLDAIGCEEVLYALLSARELAALPLDEHRGLYQVIPIDRHAGATMPMSSIPWRRPQDILSRPNFRELVMTVVTLEHLDAEQVANALRGHFALQRTWRPGSPLITASGKHSLILHGYGDQVAQTIVALQQVDRVAAPPKAAPTPALEQRIEALEHEIANLRRELRERK